jgi:hypothetical protein
MVRNASKILTSEWQLALIFVDGVPYEDFLSAPGEITLGVH